VSKVTVSLTSVVERVQNIVSSDIDGETVMMSVERGAYYGLNDIASGIWARLDRPIRVSELIDGLLARYEVDRKTCEEHVLAFLGRLSDAGILTVHE